MASVTLQLDAATRAQMKASYADYLLDPVPHSEFRAQVDGVTITAYASGKVLFQGKDVEAQVARWQGQATSTPATKKSASSDKVKPTKHNHFPEYNEANKTRNANAIKVSLHNFTIQKLLAKLSARQKLALQGVLIDEFTSPQNYFNYLKKEAHPLTKGLYFAEKGESAHLAVACASIIARAWFLALMS